MATRHALLADWIERGAIGAHRIEEALALAGIRPSRAQWRRFLDQLLLWLGVLAWVAAVVFIVAYNWQELGRFARFALVEALLLVAAAAYWRFGDDRLKGEASLVAAAILLGVLLALFGQTYQTGADPWQLFATWAALMLPWAWLGRSAVLWLGWIGLLNLAVVLYFQAFPGLLWAALGRGSAVLWALFVLDTLAWIAWEALVARSGSHGRPWPIRLVALASGTMITLLAVRALWDDESTPGLAWAVYCAWLVVLLAVYRRRLPDLFMLAGACLTVIVTVTALAAWLMLDGPGSEFVFMFLTVLVIGLAAVSAIWLSRVHDEFEA